MNLSIFYILMVESVQMYTILLSFSLLLMQTVLGGSGGMWKCFWTMFYS